MIYTLNINRIRKIVSFKLGKEIEKDFFSSCHERGKKKKILSPCEEWNLRPFGFCVSMLYHQALETLWRAIPITKCI